MSHPTTIDRTSERELVITRTFNGPPSVVFEAWSRPELLQRWWMPKSVGASFVSCEADVRTGGSYRFVFSHPSFDGPMTFHGKYLEVTPPSRIVWTNEESGEGAVTTVTFEAQGGGTRLVLHERYPSKEALDEAMASGSPGAAPEQFEQLDAVLATMSAS